ncbi:MAG: SOS response-associated peptidase family protein [Clostridia bacterium]|jgi:putative SOS response-associated peptidase YedK
MCGRFTIFTEDEIEEIREIIQDVSVLLSKEDMTVLGRDAYPSSKIPVITKEKHLKLMQWGFQKWDDEKKVIFNARSETVLTSRFFAPHIKGDRCLIPAKSYYEWRKLPDKRSEKYRLFSEEGILFIAGFKRMEKDEVTMITRDRAENIAFIHNRMPLIFSKDTAPLWFDDRFYTYLVNEKSIPILYDMTN